MKSHIMVTGGAGFIGSHLCERLVKDGHSVLSLDNYVTGSRENNAHLLETYPAHDEGAIKNPNRGEFFEREWNVVKPMLGSYDQIYNLACPASPVHYQADPVATTTTSVLGAINVLDTARFSRTPTRVLQASTSEVYGDPRVHPQVEGYWGNVNPVGIRSCYDEGKRCAESLFFDYNRQHDVDIRVIRIFNTYGPRMNPNDGRVVSNFITQALKGEPITLYGKGLQTRSFCYVDDLVDGMIRTMNQDSEIGPINLGNPCEFTILELAEHVLALTGSKSELVFQPLPQDDPTQRKPDISKAKAALDWEPQVSLIDGLKETIAYFKRVL